MSAPAANKSLISALTAPRIVQRELRVVAIEIVLALRRHGERSRHRHLDLAVGIGAQELHVADLDRMPAADRPYHARHGGKPAGAVRRLSRVIEVDAFERGGKAIGVALPALLAVGDDVEPGALLVADGEQRGVVLRRFKLLRIDQPKVVCAHARHLLGKPRAIDQPFRLRIGADESGGKQHGSFISMSGPACRGIQ